MMTFRKITGFGSALLLVAVVSHCGTSGTDGSNLDMAGPDMTQAAAPPVITAISPGSVLNSGGVQITITGTGFQQGATVKVGGISCGGVTVVSATSITCTPAATPSPQCGPVNVVVSNPDGQSASNGTLFQLKSKALGFGNPVNIPNAAGDPNSKQAITVDLNSDGKMDVVNLDEVGGVGSALPRVSIHLSNGDGTFVPTTTITLAANSNPTAVAAGDVNADGKVDLVVTLGAADQIQLLTGDGKGAFTPQTAINVGAKNPISIALGDLTGDGKLDAVVGHLAGNGFTVFTNTAGVLGAPSNQVLNSFANITSVALTDLNGDSKLDAVIVGATTNNLGVLIGNGAAKFAAPTTFNMPGGPNRLALGDFNNDKKLDVVTANVGAGTVSVRLGDGNGGFGGAAPSSSVAAGTTPTAVSVGDFDSDGNVDLVVSNSGSNTFSALIGKGDGTFGAAKSFPTNASPGSIVSADYSGDGLLDVVTTSSTTNLALNLNQCQ